MTNLKSDAISAPERYKSLVSVVIPTYNRSNTIERSVRSVLDQSYIDIEVIVVDDGSTDTTSDVIAAFKDNRIKYIPLHENSGRSRARNIGIKNAKGDYIAFQDSDDEWMKGKLEKQIQLIQSEGSDVCYCGYTRITPSKRIYIPSFSWLKRKSGWILPELIKGNFIGTPALVMRRECLVKTGLFDESLNLLEDYDLCIRLAKEFRFSFVDEALVNAYESSDSNYSNKKRMYDSLWKIMQKYPFIFARNPYVFGRNLIQILGSRITYIGNER